MKRKILIAATVLIVLVAGSFLFSRTTAKDDADILVTAEQGDFQIDVNTTGELEAKNSVKIQGPTGLRNARIWQVELDQLVDEGTVVKKGDFIAALDKTEIAQRLQEASTALQKAESQFTQARLDSALTLRQARDELVNLQYTMKEKEIVLEQSKYEPPATIRQAEIDKEKAERAYKQAKQNYKIKRNQSQAKMQEVTATLNQAQAEMNMLTNLVGEFTIKAPEDGMVIYDRDYEGKRKTVGTMIGAWDPTVATLPDLSTMISKTYVNEVDIRKVQPGQQVRIGLDAFPEKKLTGKVINVANVGEQKPNSDAKVFEVRVQINETDTTLRPAMTTSNAIIAEMVPNVVHVPLECLHNQGDSLTYVFWKDGSKMVKQQVEVGKTNSNEAIILKGVSKGDQLYLSLPKEADKAALVMLPDAAAKRPIAPAITDGKPAASAKTVGHAKTTAAPRPAAAQL